MDRRAREGFQYSPREAPIGRAEECLRQRTDLTGGKPGNRGPENELEQAATHPS